MQLIHHVSTAVNDVMVKVCFAIVSMKTGFLQIQSHTYMHGYVSTVLISERNMVAISSILQQDAIYILATYNLECFGHLLSTFAIALKESCLNFVEKQLRELAEKVCINNDVATYYRL